MLQQRRRERNPNKPGVGVAGILLIAIGLVGKLCTANGATTVHRRNVTLGKSTSTPAQLYFDAVAPEDRENFIKYHLDKALEGRLPHHTSSIPKDFEFLTYQHNRTESHQHGTSTLLELVEEINGTKLSSPAAAGRPSFIRYSIVCYRSGCIDTSDIGNICCPF
ncbi:uncharacterized protein LOC125770124 isoform X1 [Anopheles funestus]|uniref:uncharacterized protein LOC125770124 isoform X1 n=1 Tax=Anopheles funestus TaxID=62324 RepID=UPI0020C5DA33|nr:uncharacterized protein LOC125770124 isoform X1 [Anopheles funestus]